MTRTVRLVCCAALLWFHPPASAGQLPVSESTTVTLTATIESIDKANRVVTLKKADGGVLEIKAPEQMQGFNTLKVGDRVTATYYEAVVVRLKVQEPKSLQDVKAGDTVDVTYFESLLVDVARPSK